VKKDLAELVVVTDPVEEKYLRDSIAILEGMSIVKKIPALIRVYGE
jgi:homoserine dehydrogenase